MKTIECDIRAGVSILAQLSARWFQRVTNRLNNIVPGHGISIDPEETDGFKISVDESQLTHAASSKYGVKPFFDSNGYLVKLWFGPSIDLEGITSDTTTSTTCHLVTTVVCTYSE